MISGVAPLLRPWHWWLGELKSIFAPLRVNSADTLIIDASPAAGQAIQLTARDRDSALPELKRRGRRSVVHLDPQVVLRRSVQLPLAAEQNLRRVLGYEIDHLMPFPLHACYFDYQLLRRDSRLRQIEIDLAAVPTRLIDELSEELHRLGFEPAAIGLATTNTEPLFNFRPPARRRQLMTAQLLNRGLGATALLLLGVALALPLVQKARTVGKLEPQLEQMRKQALAVRQLAQELESIRTQSRFVIRKRAMESPVLDLINEVSHLLPDDTWLQEITFNGRVVHMRGEAPAAARLVAVVEASALFANARLPSPVTRAPEANNERFHLAADLSLRGSL
jgi:general secretion pathway protein L